MTIATARQSSSYSKLILIMELCGTLANSQRLGHLVQPAYANYAQAFNVYRIRRNFDIADFDDGPGACRVGFITQLSVYGCLHSLYDK